ncbi:divergent polysaccharide deacetylase family protein [Aliirhizobium terrae]|uniref:divergent polysaccharide deacetylase family protein n=1 Tax=Terrirhizobium terrae TaxID=2926709 RepID=UPI0025773AFC|nr:divergent polysaccharide deacetylase family protein [Rhizobium sp. CC-CFT758]WJH41616.1 divergent polysaccharide deacetylase family protein [Rhizobium sp. CC-CFT758]
MGTDLHAPLGQGRPPKRKPSHKRIPVALAGVATVMLLVGISVYVSFQGDGLKQTASTQPPSQTTTEAASASSPVRQSEPLERTNTGANIERTPTGDGGYVTKYTPRDRDGPQVINAQRIGQDSRMAGQPNPDLLEETEAGRLPVTGPDGLRPMDQYARPWSGARGTRIAIVVSGLGLSQTGSQKAVQQLPAGVTLAFAASGNSLQRWMQEARRKGHEILLQIPLEPFDYPANDPGPGTLLTGSSSKQNLARLHDAMAQLTNYTGIMNYQGGRYLSDEKALQPILQDVAKRGLLFLDDSTSSLSKTEAVSSAIDLPYAFADLALDGQLQTQAILRKLDDLERIADRQGTAIGVAAAFDESIEAIRQWSEEATQRGIEIVGVSAIVRDKSQP